MAERTVDAGTISVLDKSFPPSAWGLTTDEFVATSPRLSEFATPLLTLDAGAMAHNLQTMREWTTQRGLALAPHGKTTMAPRLWRQLLDAGAWGLTVATGWQAQVARCSRPSPRTFSSVHRVRQVAVHPGRG